VLFVHALKGFRKFWELFRCENGAHLRAALLTYLFQLRVQLRVHLVVDGFRLPVALQENGIELLGLLWSKRKVASKLLNTSRATLRLASWRVGRAYRTVREEIA